MPPRLQGEGDHKAGSPAGAACCLLPGCGHFCQEAPAFCPTCSRQVDNDQYWEPQLPGPLYTLGCVTRVGQHTGPPLLLLKNLGGPLQVPAKLTLSTLAPRTVSELTSRSHCSCPELFCPSLQAEIPRSLPSKAGGERQARNRAMPQRPPTLPGTVSKIPTYLTRDRRYRREHGAARTEQR